jgi:hypothetical protein
MMRTSQRPHHRREGCNVGSGAVEAQAGNDISAEEFLETGFALRCVVVGSVGESMALVGVDDGLEDGWVSASGVVASDGTAGGWRKGGHIVILAVRTQKCEPDSPETSVAPTRFKQYMLGRHSGCTIVS